MTSLTERAPTYRRYTPYTGSGSMMVIEPDVFDAAGRRLRIAALGALALCVFGFLACDFLLTSGAALAPISPRSSLFQLYALHEQPFLGLLAAFAVLVWLLARRWGAVPAPWVRPSQKSIALEAVLAACGVAIIAAAGTVVVMHDALRPPRLLNVVVAAVSIVAIACVSARLWPNDVRRGKLAILYLASSTQFLLLSMTDSAPAAQLCANLVWLYLIVRDDQLGLGAAPWVGVVALALQDPLAHALFALPFLTRVVRSRRIGWIAYFAGVYGAGVAALWLMTSRFRPLSVANLGNFTLSHYFEQGLNLSALLTWQAPAMALFLIAAIGLVRVFKAVERDLLTGLVLTFGFSIVFGGERAYAPGYDHAAPLLGSIALLAASATITLGAHRGGSLVPRLVLVSCAVAFLVQLPLRGLQAEKLARQHDAMPVTAAQASPGTLPSPSATTKTSSQRR